MRSSAIRLRGARTHNLRGIDLDLPHGEWIAFVGPSGSGKTSLVFDTLVREGEHRFLSGLSPRARQHFGKLGRADLQELRGLPPTIAVGERAFRPNVRSTVGTLTGALDLLRLLFARAAQSPGGTPLSRSHFSFNHPLGACESCKGLGLGDRVDPLLLVADARKSLRKGALVPTLKSGYTVYSQVTLEVMDTICKAHGFDVDRPWQELSQTQQDVILYGSKALKVPFGKHPIESRMKWEGITARPREEGHYRGLVPVIQETLLRNRNPNILRFVRSVPCEVCGGSRLARAGREAQLGTFRLPQLLHSGLQDLLGGLESLPASPVLQAVLPELANRLQRMLRLGLGHLSLDRESTTLSGGEGQRLRLAAQLSAGLCGVLFALDEPTLGLHPKEQAGMGAVLDELRNMGNTLAVVEHDPDMVRHADRLVSLGPGAGSAGGQLLSNAPLFAKGPLGDSPLGPSPKPKAVRRAGQGVLHLRNPRLHNLKGGEYRVHLGALNVVCGPSGAGKSSLVFGTLLPALQGESGGPHDGLDGTGSASVRALDARPIGRTSRSTPATWSGLFDLVRKAFAETEAAKQAGFGPSHFSYNTKQGRCPACEGLGSQRVGLHLMENVEFPCDLCAGGRFAQEVLQPRLRDKSIAEVLALTVDEAVEFFSPDESDAQAREQENRRQCSALCDAMQELGLGHLPIGQPSNRLSRGESQRVKLATLLGSTGAKPTILLLDEPDRGLHPSDVQLLLHAMDRLVEAHHTLVAISHHRHLWAAADFLVEVEEGKIHSDPQLDWNALSQTRAARPPAAQPTHIELRGVRTNNLRNIDVSFPRGAMTVLCGVSGSGKSSLAFDSLAAEAWQRYSESLPFEVRKHVQRMPRPELDSCLGLGPTLSLRQRGATPGSRSSVATQSGLGPLLRLLFSRAGLQDGRPTQLSAEHFSAARTLGACPDCLGSAQRQRCDERKLVTDPGRSLLKGALAGTKPGAFFSEPDGQYIATLREALGPEVDLTVAWRALSEATRQIALHGTGSKRLQVSWRMAEGNQEARDTHEFEGTWDGFLALVEREARRRANHKGAAHWSAPLGQQPCEVCDGSGLALPARQVRLGAWTLPEYQAVSARVSRQELLSLGSQLDAAGQLPAFAAWQALMPEIDGLLGDLIEFGLGHLPLGRATQRLSDSEYQRLRLAGILRSGLDGITLVLDEPTAGLQSEEVDRLCQRFRELCDAGNTLIIVEHEEQVLRAADHLIELGPGAGSAGGRLLQAGPPEQVLAGDGPTARALRRGQAPRCAQPPAPRLQFKGIAHGPLRDVSVDLPCQGIVAIAGPSGSGKSTLLRSVLGASFEARELRGAQAAFPRSILTRFQVVHGVEAPSRKGTLLGALEMLKPWQRFWFDQQTVKELPQQAFSFQSPKGRCPACNGSGRERVALDFLADLDLPCPACDGQRYRSEVLQVTWNNMNPASLLELSIADLQALLPAGKLRTTGQALLDVGLGHLCWGRSLESLSGGEVQRIALCKSLLSKLSPALQLFDDPTQGLHPADVLRLIECLQQLAGRGDLVLVSTRNQLLIDGADECLQLPARIP